MLGTFVSCSLVTEVGVDESLNWNIDDGVLTVSGQGHIGSFCTGKGKEGNCSPEPAPWFGKEYHTLILESEITHISEHAFSHAVALEKVIIKGESVTVCHSAFFGCEKLSEIENIESIVEISEDAFGGCISLTSLRFGEGLSVISGKAFADCTGLKEVYLPESVSDLDTYGPMGCTLFCGCTSLERIEIDEANPYYQTLDGVLYSRGLEKLIYYPPAKGGNSFIVPEEVVDIGNYAFYCHESLESISFEGQGPKSVGIYAFGGCSRLTSLSFGEGLTRIFDKAFADCTSLKEVYFPACLENFTSAAFDGCVSMERVVIDENNSTYTSIDGVVYTTDMREIVYYPLAKDENSYTVPRKVEKIGVALFANNTYLESVYFDGEGVTVIERNAFDGCSSLRSAELPESIRSIESMAFFGCDSLTIVCTENSYAHTYALENGIAFELK